MVDTSTEKVERLARRLLQESASATRLSSRERLVTAARMLRGSLGSVTCLFRRKKSRGTPGACDGLSTG